LGIAAPAFITVVGLAACDKPSPKADDLPSSAPIMDAAPPVPIAVAPTAMPAISAPMAPITPSNPLGLPARRLKLDAGRRVFTFSSEMLSQAKIGSTLVLYGAKVVGFEGDDLI